MSAIANTSLGGVGASSAGTSSPNQLPSGTNGIGPSSLTATDFIKFMVTSLQNQDPLQPTDANQMLSQLTSIGQLQSATDMDTALKGMVQQSSIGSAAAMIGKTVKGNDANANPIGGVVTGVQVSTAGVNLQLDSGLSLSLANLTSIVATPPSGSTSTANSSDGSSTPITGA
jgi:flagellar basal-body rod modification protein FlgD